MSGPSPRHAPRESPPAAPAPRRTVTRRRMIQGMALTAFALGTWVLPWSAGSDTVGLWGRWFLRLDPLVGLTAALASRSWLVSLVPGLVCVAACFLLPHLFCGYICPMGSVLDLCDGALKRARVKPVLRAPARWWRTVRFVVLGLVLGAAAGGVLLTAFASPLVILNRAGMAFWRLPRAVRLAPPGAAYGVLWSLAGAVLLWGAIVLCGFLAPRFWCRHLCPSGALLSVASRLGMRRRGRTKAAAGRGGGAARAGLSRREFIGAGTAGAAGMLCARGAPCPTSLIRPPGSVPETFFMSRCVSCGACMQVCPTGVLQPAGAAGGAAGMWMPHADTTLTGCERSCNACGRVCPTGAIRRLPLAEKQAARMGRAVVNRETCVAYTGSGECRLCVEQCRASGYDAIEFRRVGVELDAGGRPDEQSGRLAPVVAAERCSGCGQCEARCHQVNVVTRRWLDEAAIQVKTGSGMQDRLLEGSYIRRAAAVNRAAEEEGYLPGFLDGM